MPYNGKQGVAALLYGQMGLQLVPKHLKIYDMPSAALLVEFVNPQAGMTG